MTQEQPNSDSHDEPTKPVGKRNRSSPSQADQDNKSRKSTNSQISLRIDEVLVIRLDGAQMHDIRRYAAEKGWGVSDRQLERYIAQADELLRERLDRKRSRLLALHRARREALYARAVAAADYRTALAILDSDAKLAGLFPKDKPVQVSSNGSYITVIVDGEDEATEN